MRYPFSFCLFLFFFSERAYILFSLETWVSADEWAFASPSSFSFVFCFSHIPHTVLFMENKFSSFFFCFCFRAFSAGESGYQSIAITWINWRSFDADELE